MDDKLKKLEPELAGRVSNTPISQPEPEGHSYLEETHPEGSGIETLLESQQGYIVGRMANEFLRLDTDAHLITVAPTGAGKGRGCVIPNLLDHPGSAFVVDIRGETVARTADARLLMGQNVIVLDPYEITGGRWGSDSFNPLSILDSDHLNFEADANRITQAIMFDPKGRGSNEPIWDDSTRLAINGALLYMCSLMPKKQRNLIEFKKLFSLNPGQRTQLAKEITEAISSQILEKDINVSSFEDFIEFLTDASEKTKIPDNAFMQAKTNLAWAGRREFKNILTNSTFSFDLLQREPTTVYLVIPEEYIKGCEVWVRLLFNIALFQLKEVNSVFGNASSNLDQSQRVLFLFDEFPAFGKLEAVEQGMATVRGRGANIWLFLQHISQLDEIYGENSARSILGNAAVIQTFGSNELHELDYFSRVIGKEMFDVQSVTISANKGTGKSEAIGKTLTLGNTESVSHGTTWAEAHGTSETYSTSTGSSVSHGTQQSKAKGKSENVSHTKGDSIGQGYSNTTGRNKNRGWGDGENTSESEGLSGPYEFADMIGFDLFTKNNSKNSGTSRGQNRSRNWSKGFNTSKTKTFNKNKNKQQTKSTGTSDTFTEGSSETHSASSQETRASGKTYSKTLGGQETETKGTTRSKADTNTTTDTWNEGQSISYSCKPEEKLIETPRSLRRKLNLGGQLLILRGHFPFLTPRMDYIAKHPELKIYRFPHHAVFSGQTSLREFWEDILKTHPLFEEGVKRQLLEEKSHISSFGQSMTSFRPEEKDKLGEVEKRVEETSTFHENSFDVYDEITEGKLKLFFYAEILSRFGKVFEPEFEALKYTDEETLNYDKLVSFVQEYEKIVQVIMNSGWREVYSDHNEYNEDWLLDVYGFPLEKLISVLKDRFHYLEEYKEEVEYFLTRLDKIPELIEEKKEAFLLDQAMSNINRRQAYISAV